MCGVNLASSPGIIFILSTMCSTAQSKTKIIDVKNLYHKSDLFTDFSVITVISFNTRANNALFYA